MYLVLSDGMSCEFRICLNQNLQDLRSNKMLTAILEMNSENLIILRILIQTKSPYFHINEIQS